MRKSVYSLILTTFLVTTPLFAGDQHDGLQSLASRSQQSTHSAVPFLSDQNKTEQEESTKPKLRRGGSGGDRGGCAGKGLTRADFKAQQEKSKPTHRRRPSGDNGNGGSGNGDRGGFASKIVMSHAEFAAQQNNPTLRRVPSGHHGESAAKPELRKIPSGHHGESPQDSNDFFAYAYQQKLLNQAPLVETY